MTHLITPVVLTSLKLKKRLLIKPYAYQSFFSTTLRKTDFEIILGKGGNVNNQDFLVFPPFHLFSPPQTPSSKCICKKFTLS